MSEYPYNDYRYYLQHSAKGTTWEKKDHKYLYIDENGNYIYDYGSQIKDLKQQATSNAFDHLLDHTTMGEPKDEYERQAIKNLTASKGEAVTPEKVEKEIARLKEEERKKAEREKKKKEKKQKISQFFNSVHKQKF